MDRADQEHADKIGKGGEETQVLHVSYLKIMKRLLKTKQSMPELKPDTSEASAVVRQDSLATRTTASQSHVFLSGDKQEHEMMDCEFLSGGGFSCGQEYKKFFYVPRCSEETRAGNAENPFCLWNCQHCHSASHVMPLWMYEGKRRRGRENHQRAAD